MNKPNAVGPFLKIGSGATDSGEKEGYTRAIPTIPQCQKQFARNPNVFQNLSQKPQYRGREERDCVRALEAQPQTLAPFISYIIR